MIGLGICSSIEGLKIALNTRKFNSQSSPVFNKELGKKVYKFKLGMNGYAKIDVPLSSSQSPCYEESMLCVGDEIQGGGIDGWTEKAIKNGDITVDHLTGTHKATFVTFKGRFYAHVQSVHRDHAESEEVQKRHPNVIQTFNPAYKTELF